MPQPAQNPTATMGPENDRPARPLQQGWHAQIENRYEQIDKAANSLHAIFQQSIEREAASALNW